MTKIICHHKTCINNKRNKCTAKEIKINEFVAYDGTVFDVCSQMAFVTELQFKVGCRHQADGPCRQCQEEAEDRRDRIANKDIYAITKELIDHYTEEEML